MPLAAGAPEGPEKSPVVVGGIEAEFQLDNTAGVPRGTGRETQVEITTEYDVAMWWTPGVALNGAFSLDSTDNRYSDRKLDVGDVGLRLKELYLQLVFDQFAVFAGKFELDFGTAPSAAYGLYGQDLAEEYEFDERIGFGAAFRLGAAGGFRHELTTSAFFADATALSGDLISRRDRLRQADGGVSNTGDPRSFAVTLHGLADPPSLLTNYSASFIYQAAGHGDPEDLYGFAFSLTGNAPVSDRMNFEWLGEVATLIHAEGGFRDRTYVTVSGRLNYGSAWLAPSLTRRIETGAGAAVQSTTLGTVSIGYDFDSGISVSAGVQLFEDDQAVDTLFGLKLSYSLDF